MTEFFGPEGHTRSNVMVPIESQWVLHTSSSRSPTSHLSPFSTYPSQRILILIFNLSWSSKESPWSVSTMSVTYNIVSVAILDIFHVKNMTSIFDPQGHPMSNLTVPIESPWLLLEKSSLGPTSYLSPFSKYFVSYDCDLDL